MLRERGGETGVTEVRRPVGSCEAIASLQRGVSPSGEKRGDLGGAALAAKHHQRAGACLRVLMRERAIGGVLLAEELQL